MGMACNHTGADPARVSDGAVVPNVVRNDVNGGEPGRPVRVAMWAKSQVEDGVGVVGGLSKPRVGGSSPLGGTASARAPHQCRSGPLARFGSCVTPPVWRVCGTRRLALSSRAATSSRSVSNRSAYTSNVIDGFACPNIRGTASTFAPACTAERMGVTNARVADRTREDRHGKGYSFAATDIDLESASAAQFTCLFANPRGSRIARRRAQRRRVRRRRAYGTRCGGASRPFSD
jgi:hypothetical protein